MNNLHDAPDDLTALRDPRLARTSAVAGVASIVLAPIVVGLLVAAFGLHGAITHLRFREGSRGLAWFGLIASALGAIISAGAALLWGSVLMTVLLQRSAVHQAQSWENTPAGAWSLVDLKGTSHSGSELIGSIVLIDCFAPNLSYCGKTTSALSSFAASHDDVVAISWGVDADAESATTFARSCGVRHAIAVGRQSMPEPFSLMAAKPTLVVIDAHGVIRNVVLGSYDENDLVHLLEAALQPLKDSAQRDEGSATSSSARSTK